ncbi:hypothetical protein [Aeromonas sp. A600556]|uniref:hypothetical protein n=1 Tax=Aeromonas sp. A600556 TaxID=2712058 RepID=UPI003F89E077
MNKEELQTKIFIEKYGTTLAAIALNTTKQKLNHFRVKYSIRTPSNDAINERLGLLIKAAK